MQEAHGRQIEYDEKINFCYKANSCTQLYLSKLPQIKGEREFSLSGKSIGIFLLVRDGRGVDAEQVKIKVYYNTIDIHSTGRTVSP